MERGGRNGRDAPSEGVFLLILGLQAGSWCCVSSTLLLGMSLLGVQDKFSPLHTPEVLQKRPEEPAKSEYCAVPRPLQT